MRSIYLDYLSSTPIAASVRDSMLPYLDEFYGHPSSHHWFGRAAAEAIEDSRNNIASLLGSLPSEIVFTSGGTESINIGVLGAARHLASRQPAEPPHAIHTSLEHQSLLNCFGQLKREGWDVDVIPCDENGIASLEAFESAIRPTTRLASVIHANHQIGTVQPLEEFAHICQRHNIILHTDACQSIGKIDCEVDKLGVDLLSFSGHKFYAPKGIGGLYVRTGVSVDPLMWGDASDGGLRPGTPNVAHIVALGQAAKLASRGLGEAFESTKNRAQEFRRQLEQLLGIQLVVHGEHVPRLPGVMSIELPALTVTEIQQMLPEICFGPATSGCCENATKPQDGTHAAIGLSASQSARSLRVSLGWTSNPADIRQAAQMIAAAIEARS